AAPTAPPPRYARDPEPQPARTDHAPEPRTPTRGPPTPEKSRPTRPNRPIRPIGNHCLEQQTTENR
ncbi:MAG: hypothetical protein QM518_14330, partial [Verrucomicrobiota bacterium]|nr:hypothetical protein [Verrucomicrobiota bacterium]